MSLFRFTRGANVERRYAVWLKEGLAGLPAEHYLGNVERVARTWRAVTPAGYELFSLVGGPARTRAEAAAALLHAALGGDEVE